MLSGKTWDAENIKDITIIGGNLVDLESKAILLANLLKGTMSITSVTSCVHDSVLVNNFGGVVHDIVVHDIMVHNRLSIVRNNRGRGRVVHIHWSGVRIHVCVGVVQTSRVRSVHVGVGVVCAGVGAVDISMGIVHKVLSLSGLRGSNCGGEKRNLSEGSHIYSIEWVELIYY